MVSLLVVIVVAKFKALPNHVTLFPTVIPALSIIVPLNVESAPSVVAFGVQNISQAFAQGANVVVELATVVSAPLILKMYVQAPRVIPPAPIDAAAVIQYTQATNG